MTYYVKNFSYSAVLWLLFLVIDTYRVLFTLNVGDSARTLMGVNIEVTSTSEMPVVTDFVLTAHALWGFGIVVGVWLIIAGAVRAYSRHTSRNNSDNN